MKTIIAGVRGLTDGDLVFREVNRLNAFLHITEVFSGRATGADYWGEEWAKANNVPIRPFPADWAGLGKKAGPIRNNQMADLADALIAFWDGFSPGTKNMLEEMCNRAKPSYVVGLGKNYGSVMKAYRRRGEVVRRWEDKKPFEEV